MGGAALASVLHVAGHPSPTHCCHPIVVVRLPSFYHCPQNAAVVVGIAADGSGGGIVTIAVAIAVAIPIAVSAIAVIAVIVDIASTTLLHHCHCHHAFWRPIVGAGPNHSSPNCPH